MKKIVKIEPAFFREYKHDYKPSTWQQLSHAIGPDVRTYILSGMTPLDGEINPSEQNYQCAYTELPIEPDSDSSHVDHFRKQSMFQDPRHIFNWNNIFTACNNNDIGAKFKDRYIKESDYDYLINPALENPNKYLTYNLLGKVVEVSKDINSEDYKKANRTICLLNLNEHYLKQQRLTVSKQVKAVCNQLTLENIKEDLGKFDSFVEFVYNSFQE